MNEYDSYLSRCLGRYHNASGCLTHSHLSCHSNSTVVENSKILTGIQAILEVGFPLLHKPYPYNLGEDSSILGT